MPNYGRTRDTGSIQTSQSTLFGKLIRVSDGYSNYNFTHNNTQRDICKDTVTPGYRDLVADGEIINNDCYMSFETNRVTENGSYYQRDANGHLLWYIEEGPVSCRNILFDSQKIQTVHDTPDDLAIAKQQALANIDTTPYGFAEDVGEILETLRFIKDPLESLKEVSRAMKRSKHKLVLKQRRKRKGSTTNKYKNLAEAGLAAATDEASALSGAFLAHQFALQPLIRSIDDAISSVVKYTPPPPVRRTARGKVVSKLTETEPFQDGSPSTHWAHVNTLDSVHDTRAAILYEVKDLINDWRFKYGLRGKDIPRTFWDLFPYSFMIDRLFHIGNTISGLTNLADASVKILAASTTVRKTRTHSSEIVDRALSNQTFEIQNAFQIDESFIYDRQVWTPTVFDTFPRLTPLNLIKDAQSTAELVSLIFSNITGRPGPQQWRQ
jgi:hypothetical protein